MKVQRKPLVAMFLALGFKTADKWNAERMGNKVAKLATLTDSSTKLEDKEAQNLLAAILAALKEEKEITIVQDAASEAKEPVKDAKPTKAPKDEDEDDDEEEDDEEEEEEEEDDEEEEPAPKKAKKAKKPPASDEEDEEDEDEDDEDEDEEEEKPKKKGKAKKSPFVGAGGEGKPGIIASIVEFLEAAGAKEKPISKDKILEKLTARFPDRKPESMKSTIVAQTSYHLKAKGVKLHKNDKGRMWIEPSKK